MKDMLLNAANARWMSLYDSLYGTDVSSNNLRIVPHRDMTHLRGEMVINYGRNFLEKYFPLHNLELEKNYWI